MEAAQQEAAAAQDAAPAHLRALQGGEAQLVFLGTMSACPSKYRNVTSLHLDLGTRGGLLMDAGEDCYGQLQRRWVRVWCAAVSVSAVRGACCPHACMLLGRMLLLTGSQCRGLPAVQQSFSFSPRRSMLQMNRVLLQAFRYCLQLICTIWLQQLQCPDCFNLVAGSGTGWRVQRSGCAASSCCGLATCMRTTTAGCTRCCSSGSGCWAPARPRCSLWGPFPCGGCCRATSR